MDIQTAINKCIVSMGAKRAQSTAKAYKTALDAFVKYLRSVRVETTSPLENLNIEHFIEFPDWLAGYKFDGKNRYSKMTVNVYLSGIKFFMDWLVIKGQLMPDYSQSLRIEKSYRETLRKRETKMPRFPEKHDIDKMRTSVRDTKQPSPRLERDIALIETLSSTGCRISELTKLNISDVDVVNKTAVVTGKGSKERRVYFGSEAITALQKYWRARGFESPSDPVFCRHDRGSGKKTAKRMTSTTARNIIKYVAMVAGVDPNKISPHYFRHDFAIKMLRSTQNLALVQDLMGHADPKATRVYAKIYPDELKAAHEKMYH